MAWRSRGAFVAMLAAGGGWLLLFVAAPLASMAWASLLARTAPGEPAALTLDHYREAMGAGMYRILLLKTLAWSLLIGALAVVLAYPLALFASRRGPRTRALMLFAVLLPLWTNYLVRVYAWRTILGDRGFLNQLLVAVGALDAPSSAFLYSLPAVVLTLVYVTVPFAFVPIYAALERIPRGLDEAAGDLGAGPWRRFRHVTLPLSLPGVVAGFALAFVYAMGDYMTPKLVGGVHQLFIGQVIYDQFGLAANWSLASALGFTLFVVVLAVLGVLYRAGHVRAVFEE